MGGKRGKRIGVHSDWRIAFVRRVIAARNTLYSDDDYPTRGSAQRKMAEALAEKTGREINYDTYRKYEIEDAARGGALLRQDLLVPFCELTRVHITALLEGPVAPVQETVSRVPKKRPPKGVVRPFRGKLSGTNDRPTND